MACLSAVITAMAQQDNNEGMKPQFGLELTSELQTANTGRFNYSNLLKLKAGIPVSSQLSVDVASLTSLHTSSDPVCDDMQGFTNLFTDNTPFTLYVCGVTWLLNDHNSLFLGIRTMDEDYFCSDALSFFTNSSYGIFPTLSANYAISTYPLASLGVHYKYNKESFTLQGSLYNGLGHSKLTGSENIFRFCPRSDRLFGLTQAEYRHADNHYFLGTAMHYGKHVDADVDTNVKADLDATIWGYTEQHIARNATLLAAYSHAFSNACTDYASLGIKCDYKKTEFGLALNYAKYSSTQELATELSCSIAISNSLSINPVLHVIANDDHKNLCGQLRFCLSLGGE